MNFRSSLVSVALLGSLVGAAAYAQAASESQKVTLSEKVRIPGASLKPGDYTFSIEDRLQDRAIVRISTEDQSKHFLVLSVPSAKLPQQGGDGLIRFETSKGKEQVLRGWACQGCTPALEFVYPKAEAAKLTDQTAEPVLAVDPTYDKLPANLSPDDMKVVTLWLLQPERITASNKGKGVKAEKYASAAQPGRVGVQAASTAPVAGTAASTSDATSEVAQVPAPTAAATQTPTEATPAASPAVSATPEAGAAAPVSRTVVNATPEPTQLASAATVPPSGRERSRLPKTASSNYAYVFAGMLLIVAAFGVRLSRRFAFSR